MLKACCVMNEGFSDIVRDDRKNRTLFGLFPELTRETLDGIDKEDTIHVTYGDSFYRMEIRHICVDERDGIKLDTPSNGEEEVLWAVYLFDETEILTLKKASPIRTWWQDSSIWTTTMRPLRVWRRCAAPFWWPH